MIPDERIWPFTRASPSPRSLNSDSGWPSSPGFDGGIPFSARRGASYFSASAGVSTSAFNSLGRSRSV
jgi:hypothetical protein